MGVFMYINDNTCILTVCTIRTRSRMNRTCVTVRTCVQENIHLKKITRAMAYPRSSTTLIVAQVVDLIADLIADLKKITLRVPILLNIRKSAPSGSNESIFSYNAPTIRTLHPDFVSSQM